MKHRFPAEGVVAAETTLTSAQLLAQDQVAVIFERDALKGFVEFLNTRPVRDDEGYIYELGIEEYEPGFVMLTSQVFMDGETKHPGAA